MDPESQLIKTCMQMTLASAYKYNGSITQEQLSDNFSKAVQWAREVSKNNAALVEANEHAESTDKYLQFTYLVYDKMNNDHGMSSTQFRAAATHHKLADKAVFQNIRDDMYKEALKREEASAGTFAQL